MVMMRIGYSQARNRAKSATSVMRRAHGRLDPEVWPAVTPGFSLTPGSVVFTLGSCFARNVEEHLARLGFTVPVLDYQGDPQERSGRPAGILNKYTPPSISQEIAWTADVYERDDEVRASDCEAFKYTAGDGHVLDTNLGGYVPVTEERFLNRRRDIYRINRKLFEADCLILTLGHVEAWYDRQNCVYVQEFPNNPRLFLDGDDRFELHVLDYETCRVHLVSAVERIWSINPDLKVLMTTSPVPMNRTFTDQDIIVQNTYSKSLLRVVAGAIAANYQTVDYFPSYESVVLTKSWEIWGADKTHVSDEFVGKVVQRLEDIYVTELDPAQRHFQAAYTSLRGNELERAANEIEAALSLDTSSPKMLVLKARILIAQELPRQAIEILSPILEAGDADFDAAYQAGRAYHALKEPQTAATLFRQACSLHPNSVSAQIVLYDALLDAGEMAAASEVASELIEEHPHNPRSYQVYLHDLHLQSSAQAAVEVGQQAVDRFPTNPKLRHQLAACLMKTDLEEAERQQRYAVELRPKAYRIVKQLADILCARNKPREAADMVAEIAARYDGEQRLKRLARRYSTSSSTDIVSK